MNETPRPLALVTGASAGIGAAFARALADRKYDVALVARRVDRLEALAEDLRTSAGVDAFAIQADLAVVDAHAPIMAALESRGRHVDMLVNNAGFSLPKSYAATSWAEQRDFVMTLVMAVCGLTHAVLPGMIARGGGRIIHVGSIAGFSPGAAGHTLYPAAKSFVAKFAMSLAAEVRDKNVRVTCVAPGSTKSDFQKSNGMSEIMDKAPPGPVMSAESVVAAALRANDRGQVVVIPGVHNQIAVALMKYLPDGLVGPVLRRAADKYRMPD